MSVPTDQIQHDADKRLKEKFCDHKEVYDLIVGNQALREKVESAITSGKIGHYGFSVATKDERGIQPDGYYYDFRRQTLVVSRELYEGMKSGDPARTQAFVDALSAAAAESANPDLQFSKFLSRMQKQDDKGVWKNDDRLSNVFDKSPYMAELAVSAIRNNNLRSIYDVDGSVLNNAGASYDYTGDSRRILVSENGLGQFEKSKPLNGDTEKYKFIFQMGHELGHASRGDTLRAIDERLVEQVKAIASSPEKRGDYTAAVSEFLEARRTEEAKAHIDGFNAVASALKKEKPNATIEDLRNALPKGYANDFFQNDGTGDIKEGLTFDPTTLRLQQTQSNIDRMKGYYFDQTAKEAGLGQNGDVDYRNKYGSYAIETLYKHIPSGSEVRLNMKDLKLDEGMVEKNLSFPGNQKRPYINTSDGKSDQRNFDPGLKYDPTKQPQPSDPTTKPCSTSPGTQPAENKPPASETPLVSTMPANLTNVDHLRMLTLTHGLLEKDADKYGLKTDEQRLNLTGAIAESAIRSGMKNIDHLVVSTDGKNLIPIEGKDPTAPWANRAAVDIEKGMHQPQEQSLASMERHQQLQQQQQQTAQLNPSQQQSGPSIGARKV